MSEQQHRLYDLAQEFDSAFLVTNAGGQMHARPMQVAELKPDADAVFVTSLESPKIAEIEADPHVLLTFQSRSKFAAINGAASVVRDRGEVDRLWSEAWRVWFPAGKDDPQLCLLRIKASEGELWDRSGWKGVKFLFRAAKAVASGTQPEITDDEHAKTKL